MTTATAAIVRILVYSAFILFVSCDSVPQVIISGNTNIIDAEAIKK